MVQTVAKEISEEIFSHLEREFERGLRVLQDRVVKALREHDAEGSDEDIMEAFLTVFFLRKWR